MRVGVYVDGYNLYYGGRGLCGRRTPGWRWLDVRAMVTDVVRRRHGWPGARCERVVYCTARVDGRTNPDAHRDQDVYLKALVAHGAVDHIEYGAYVAQVLNVEEKGSDWGYRPAEGWGTTSRRACWSTSCAGTSTRRSSSRTTATCGCRCTRRGSSYRWAS